MSENTNPTGSQTATARPISLFRRAANDGTWFGLLLTAIIILMGAMPNHVVLLLPFIALFFAVPLVMFALMRRHYAASRFKATFSELWMQGICTFFLGSILMALVVYVTLRFGMPGYINDIALQAIDTYNAVGTPEAVEMARNMQLMVDRHMLPSAINIAFSLIWSVTFTGSLLSMVLALLVRAFTHADDDPHELEDRRL